MSGLLAADIVPAALHFLEDISVADLGADGFHAVLLHEIVEPEVAHYRDHSRVSIKYLLFFHALGKNCDYAVAVDDPAVFIDRKAPVGVAVERESSRHAAVLNVLAELTDMRGAAVVVDVGAVRLVCDELAAVPEVREKLARRSGGASIRAVEAEALIDSRVVPRSGAFPDVLNVVGAGAAESGDPPDLDAVTEPDLVLPVEDKSLYLLLNAVRELESLGGKQLYAVVFHGIMRSGDHNARVRIVPFHKISHRRSRHNSKQQRVCSHGSKSSGQRRLQNFRGNAGIHANDYIRVSLAALLSEDVSRRPSYLHCPFACEFRDCNAARAVRAENSSHIIAPVMYI